MNRHHNLFARSRPLFSRRLERFRVELDERAFASGDLQQLSPQHFIGLKPRILAKQFIPLGVDFLHVTGVGGRLNLLHRLKQLIFLADRVSDDGQSFVNLVDPALDLLLQRSRDIGCVVDQLQGLFGLFQFHRGNHGVASRLSLNSELAGDLGQHGSQLRAGLIERLLHLDVGQHFLGHVQRRLGVVGNLPNATHTLANSSQTGILVVRIVAKEPVVFLDRLPVA